nr:glycosyltransferase family 39 protein [Candidatus Njordarchaeum guaymaensis]
GFAHRRMWDLKGMEYVWLPLPHLLGAFILLVTNTSSLNSIRIVNLVIGAATIFPVYRLSRRLHSPQAAKYSSLLFAFFPLVVFVNICWVHETLTTFLVALAADAFTIEDQTGKYDFAAGILLGLASITRYEAWVIAALFLVLHAVQKRSATMLIPFVIGYSIVFLPYLWHTYNVTGDMLYGPKTQFFTFSIGEKFLTSGSRLLEIKDITAPISVLSLFGITLALASISRRDSVVFAPSAVYLAFAMQFFDLYPRLVLLPVSLMLVPIGRLLHGLVGKADRKKTVALVVLACLLPYSVSIRFLSGEERLVNVFDSPTDFVGARYKGEGVVTDIPMIVHRLVNEWHVPHNSIYGFTYVPENRLEALVWFKSKNIRWIIFTSEDYDRSQRLFPELIDGKSVGSFVFAFRADTFRSVIIVYSVT